MSTRVKLTINNQTSYKLTLYEQWGGPYSTPPPHTIRPGKQGVNFALADNDRAGVVYLATDASGNEAGFVTMSYTCPELSDNSAEGSPCKSGIFISAGLQTYSGSGTPVSFTYNVGTPSLACWDSGSNNNGITECHQTSMRTWGRVLISVNNPKLIYLNFKGTWQNGPWTKLPATIPACGSRIFILNDNDRAGIYYYLDNSIPINLSFTCPELSNNSAEGSPLAGLQFYPEEGTPTLLNYIIGNTNQACWNHGDSNDGEIECPQTNVGNLNSWMMDCLALIGPRALKHICIPGSHDAGMSISHDGTAGANSCNTLTQTQNILGQLNFGSRYFDIRPIIGSGQYFTGHYTYAGSILEMQGARGESMANIIAEINAFTAINNELVILNLSHDMNTDTKINGRYPEFTVAQWHGLFDQLKGLNNLYCVNDYPDLTSVTINTFIKGKSCVIIIVDTAVTTIDSYKGQGFFTQSCLNPYNKYSSTNSVEEMSKDQIEKMNTERGSNKYFLLSWTLTQSDLQAATCVLGTASSILELAKQANGMLSHTLFPTLNSAIYPNIIYIDDFSTGNSTVLSIYIDRYILQQANATDKAACCCII